MLPEWMTRNRVDPGYLPTIENKLFFEGERKTRMISNYVVMLTLSTVIATFGVISGSTGTVIGAMIIAPLMTPIMGATLAMVLGSGHRIRWALKVVALSVLCVIGIAIVLSSFISPTVVDFALNPEITSRVSPDLLNLFIALAAGAAGAFAISREDIPDALPGVAISVALLPPLTLVGIALSKTQWLSAGGAFMLFLTNFLAILFAGGIVLWISGVNVHHLSTADALKRKGAFEVAIVALIIVSILLGFNGYRTLEQDRDAALALDTVDQWLEGTQYFVTRLSLSYHVDDIMISGPAHILIVIAGNGELPKIDQLAQSLEETLGYPVTIEQRVISEQFNYYPEVLESPNSFTSDPAPELEKRLFQLQWMIASPL